MYIDEDRKVNAMMNVNANVTIRCIACIKLYMYVCIAYIMSYRPKCITGMKAQRMVTITVHMKDCN